MVIAVSVGYSSFSLSLFSFQLKVFYRYSWSNYSDILTVLIVNISLDSDVCLVYTRGLCRPGLHFFWSALPLTSGLREGETVQRCMFYPAQTVLTVVSWIGGADEAAAGLSLLWQQAELIVVCLNRLLHLPDIHTHSCHHTWLQFAECVAGIQTNAEHLHNHTVVIDHWCSENRDTDVRDKQSKIGILPSIPKMPSIGKNIRNELWLLAMAIINGWVFH